MALEFDFDIFVTGLTREQAEAVLDAIIAKAEEFGGQVGGGFVETEAGDAQGD